MSQRGALKEGRRSIYGHNLKAQTKVLYDMLRVLYTVAQKIIFAQDQDYVAVKLGRIHHKMFLCLCDFDFFHVERCPGLCGFYDGTLNADGRK